MLKRWVQILLMQVMLQQGLLAQSISHFEYFFDTDPGVGNGTSYTPATADSVTISIALNITGVPAGYHYAGIRAKNTDGKWSHTEFRSLYIIAVPASTNTSITRMEYFIDTDPGIGNGTAVNFSSADSVTNNFLVDITGVTSGYHLIGIRSLNTSGIWSFAEFRSLFVVPPPDNNNQEITAGELYFGETDPGIGNAASFIVNPAGDSITVLRDTVLNNLPLAQYKINLRFKDNRGIWSHQETRNFTVCSTYGAQSEFTYQVEGNQVFFTNSSLYQDTVSWRFGDNTTDTVWNPIKTYANPGLFNVQLITGNNCGIDTLAEPIEIRGLQRVNANRAGNAGVSTLMFEGFGFSGSTQVKLISGAQVFTPVSQTFINSTRIRANFNLTGFTPGVYRAMATLGSAFDTLNNAVTIEQSIPVNLTLSVPNGRFLKRPGGVRLDGTIYNNGSHDAVMVPYVITGGVLPGTLPVNMNPFVSTSMVFLQNEGVFQHTYQYLTNNNVPGEVMLVNDLDTARKRHIVAYYKVRVPGHSSKAERVKFSNSSAPPLYAYQTGTLVLGPLLDSYAFMDSVHTDYQPCYSAFLKHEVEKQLNITVNAVNWNTCFAAAFDTLMRTLANISQNPVVEDFGVPMQAGFSALLAQMADCSGSGVPANLGGIQFKRIIQGVMNNWIYVEDVDSLDSDCLDTTIQVFARKMNILHKGGETGRILSGNCADCPGNVVFPEMCDQCLPLIQAGKVGEKLKVNGHAWAANSAVKGCQEWCETTSVDPNAKYGPGNNDDRKYINHRKEVQYKITFENLASATAPAAYVEIIDSIDRSVFDISTFKLGLFAWGDSLISADPNEQNVSLLKNIKPAHPNFLRIDATTDTASGIITWKFWTLDTVTLQLTTNPAEGFLPPNTDGVSGAGFVTFSIAPKSSVTNGTGLKNRASIIFDNNAPLLTNEWEYKIDTLKPSGAVNSLPVTTQTTNFNVSWNATDAHAGVDRYSVYVSINDSAYHAWQSLINQTSATYTGQIGKTYKFFSVALDRAGNLEDAPLNPIQNPDAVTTLAYPLPLNLTSFIARKTPDMKKVDLLWTTTHEQNVSHFEIQRSADAVNFSILGRVNALNIAGGNNYYWQDIKPLPIINYYRLKIVDADASFKISPVRTVQFTENDDILVFPTITNNFVFVQSKKEVIAKLISITGELLQQKAVKGSISFDLSPLPSGAYLISIEEGKKKFKIFRQ